MRTLAFFGLVSGLLAGASVSCIITNPEHCSRHGEDYCGSGMACNTCINTVTGCADIDQINDGCFYDYGSGSATDGTDSTTGTTGTTTGPTSGTTMVTDSDTVTTGPTSTTSGTETDTTTTGPECTDDNGCGGATPYCVGEVCVGCQDGGADYCLNKDGALPACDADSGSCVQCTSGDASACAGETPVCDDGSKTCTACTEHSECPLSACDLEVGSCMPEGNVWWVDSADGGCSDGGPGTEAMPFCTIGAGVGQVGMGQKGTVMVKKGTGDYQEQVGITQTKTVAIIGMGMPVIEGNADGLQPSTGPVVYVSGLELSGAGAQGVDCDTSTVWIDDSVLSGNGGGGISANGCELHVRRVEVVGNPGGGLSVSGGSEVWMENSVVGKNGDGSSLGGLNSQGSTWHVAYTTFAGNNAANGGFDTMNCDGDAGEVRNSILTGQSNDSVDAGCGPLTFENNALDTAAVKTASDKLIGAWDTGWWVNVPMNDFHLSASGEAEFMDVALWTTGDPAGDIDGDARPTTDMTADYAGADRP